jgi:uncharacterized 2Fe-2S/4Fe-4S cluster protein (DUF4445 family)
MATHSEAAICRVHFNPGNIDVAVERGSSLLEAANQAGVGLIAVCGGAGTCGNCKVLLEEGVVETNRTIKLSDEDYNCGFRQACQSKVMSDLRVRVPVGFKLDNKNLTRKIAKTTEEILSGRALTTGWRFSPPLRKYFLKLPQPTLSDNISDLSRLLRSLRKEHNLSEITVDFDILKKLPEVLRDGDWQVTVTMLTISVDSKPAATRKQSKIVNIEPGDTSGKHYSLVFDIGTTTIKSQLLDLNHGLVVDEAVEYNSQITYGADIITRIVYCQKPGGLKILQQAVVKSINTIIHRLIVNSDIDKLLIGHISVAGNTAMTQILLGVDPKYIMMLPYTPTANYFPTIKANSIGIDVCDHVYLTTSPLVASYVGGDITAGVVAAGMHRTKKLTLYLDIGTNGQIVIGNSSWMVTAACSAGPAFEGGEIKHGIIASDGAIEECEIDLSNFEPEIRTVGGVKPMGICGSGLISIIAALMQSGIIGQNGHFNTEIKSDRVRQGDDGYEYVLARGVNTESGNDIVITEIDIDKLIRAKAAIYAGFRTLMNSVGFESKDIRRVIIAGAFGNYINIDKAIVIGLLPDIPRNRFKFIGNGSLTGARMAEFSTDITNAVGRVACLMTNVELSEDTNFMNNYMAALFLPHTNIDEFPTIDKKLMDQKAGKYGAN